MRAMAGVLATAAVLAGSGCTACDPYYSPDACRGYNAYSGPGSYGGSGYSDSNRRHRDEGRRSESKRDDRPSRPPESRSSDNRNTVSGAVSDALSRSGRGP